MNPRPRPGVLAEWYAGKGDGSEDWTDHFAGYYRRKFEVDRDLFREYVDRIRRYKAAGRFLDVGCGNGASLVAAREAGFEIQGIEPGAWAQDWAREYDLPIRRVTLMDNDFPDGYFDVVFSKSFMEHVTSPSAALREMRRLLKDDGLLVCAGVPNFDSFTIRIGRDLFCGNKPPAHLYYFQTRTLAALIKESGFSLCEVRSWGLPNQVLAGLLGRKTQTDVKATVDKSATGGRKGWLEAPYRWARALVNRILNYFDMGAVTDVYAWKKGEVS
ncbi:MAG: class I SAM-dependent methyltransferase [Anaerolineae bacterium]